MFCAVFSTLKRLKLSMLWKINKIAQIWQKRNFFVLARRSLSVFSRFCMKFDRGRCLHPVPEERQKSWKGVVAKRFVELQPLFHVSAGKAWEKSKPLWRNGNKKPMIIACRMFWKVPLKRFYVRLPFRIIILQILKISKPIRHLFSKNDLVFPILLLVYRVILALFWNVSQAYLFSDFFHDSHWAYVMSGIRMLFPVAGAFVLRSRSWGFGPSTAAIIVKRQL